MAKLGLLELGGHKLLTFTLVVTRVIPALESHVLHSFQSQLYFHPFDVTYVSTFYPGEMESGIPCSMKLQDSPLQYFPS